MNNNNNNTNNNMGGLDAVSLGSVDNGNNNLNVPVNDLPPVEPVGATTNQPVENLNTPSPALSTD